MKSSLTPFAALVAASFLAFASPARAQERDDWRVTIAPYAFGASMDGTVALRGREAAVDLAAGDLFEDLEFGAMGLVAARKGDWGVLGDAFYVALGESVDLPPAEVDTSYGFVTVQGLRRLNNSVDLTFGARWQRVDGEIALRAPVEMRAKRSRDWVDPVVGVVLRTAEERRWHATLIADVGGFGAGSELTWQVFPSVGWRVTETASVELGWRHIETDFEDGEGADRFAWDIALDGPAVGVAFRF